MGLGKSTLYSILPAGTRYRELWLPELINSHATLPRSVEPGHDLTLTGARKGTTCDGVHFIRSIASNINCAAIHNAAPKLWVSFRFKFDQTWTSGSPVNARIWGKWIDNSNFIHLTFSTNGYFYFAKFTGGASDFEKSAGGDTWEAGRWYHALASISSANGVRFRIDNGTPSTDPDVSAAPNGGNFCIGDRRDPGGNESFPGVIADFVCGTDDLTTTKEEELYKGIPPADAVNFWPLDEGRGVTAYDRGSGGNNGTLDTSCTWDYGECRHPVLSLDGINDRGQSSSGIDVSGDLSLVWVGKMKSTYEGLAGSKCICKVWVDDNNQMSLYYRQPSDVVLFEAYRDGTVSYNTIFSAPLGRNLIDEYAIALLTATGSALRSYLNGSLTTSQTNTGTMSGGAASAFLGRWHSAAYYDVSKPLFVALIDGAFSERQVRTFSKVLNDILGLGLTI